MPSFNLKYLPEGAISKDRHTEKVRASTYELGERETIQSITRGH